MPKGARWVFTCTPCKVYAGRPNRKWSLGLSAIKHDPLNIQHKIAVKCSNSINQFISNTVPCHTPTARAHASSAHASEAEFKPSSVPP